MGRFVVRRIGSMLFVAFMVSVLIFGIFNVLPGDDPAVRMAGKQPTPGLVEQIRREWRFDQSIPEQYVHTMKLIATGELQSYTTRTPVFEELKNGAPATLSLAIGAFVIWMGFGILFGVLSAIKAGRFADRALTILALIGISMPVFWVGALMSYFIGFKTGLFPNGGYVPLTENPLSWLHHMVLPWTALALLFIGVYSRVLRSNILDTINDDYVRTARAKGLTERQVMTRHVLRNSLIPVFTLAGLDFGIVLTGGAILTESVFDLQGIGSYTADAIGLLDVPPVLAVTFFGAFFIVILNTLVGILYAALDPRIRLA